MGISTLSPGTARVSAPERAANASRLPKIPEAARSNPPFGAMALLTMLVLFVHGYHPLADDGALYVAGIKKLLHPRLFQTDAVFVTSHVRVSVFAHLAAWLVRSTHLPLPILLLILHLLSIFLFLLGAWKVAAKIFPATRARSTRARYGALLLAAACFTLPVAGTSLFLMDPYVTARSFSTPFGLFALAATLDGAWADTALWLVLAASMDFLMAGYMGIFLLMLALAQRGKWRGMAVASGAALAFCAAVFCATLHPRIDLPASQAALSRSYFFLSTWKWYQFPGLLLPLLLFSVGVGRTRARGAAGHLSAAALVTGSCALLASLCFVHRTGSLLLARVQVLRSFHPIYLVGLLLVGGLLGQSIGAVALRRPRLKSMFYPALLYSAVLAAMFAGQRLTYPASYPIEWPGIQPRNPWQKAFLWVRANTPENSVFALDANYILEPGEDAQGFRATAERSMLADWVKDGGIACISRAAQAPWLRQVKATRNLDRATDAERSARLLPLGATWILLRTLDATAFLCPYDNGTVKVCRLGIKRKSVSAP